MAERQPQLYLPPRTRRRISKEYPKRPLDSDQTPLTPTALFKSCKDPGSIDHTHDFRQCRAIPKNTNDNSKNDGADIPYLTLENDVQHQQPSTSSNTSSTALLPPSVFICIICHTWIHIATSTYRHCCSCADYATHHYHAKGPWIRSTEYECCGCGNHVEISYHDPIVPMALLSDLSSAREKATEQSKPTIASTVVTCQTYIRDLLGNTRRNINSKNRHFVERIGLDNVSLRLLGLIGFTYRDELFMAPGDIDNNRLCMIHEELGALLARLGSTTKLPLPIDEATHYPYADAAILDGLLGRRDLVENVSFRIDTGLDDLCAKLGVTSSAADELILWAYRQLLQEQWMGQHELLETVENIAAIKDSDLLRTELAVERSKESPALGKKVDRAYQYFGAQKDIDDDTIITAHRYKKQDFPRRGATHDENLRIIGKSRQSDMILQYLENESSGSDSGYQTRRSRNGPVGLTNIGNTCYLNSLLQYYYTLKPFRDTIINMNDYVEDEDSADWKGKKLGGIQVDQKEVKRAKKFMGLLQNIFIQLQHTNDHTIAPELELAKMALLSEEQVSTLDNDGSNTDGDTVGDNVTKQNEAGGLEGGSNSISNNNSTTMEQHASSNSVMNESQPSETTDTKPLDTIDLDSTKKAQQANDINMMMVGKQQDVTECMDNMAYLVEVGLKTQHTKKTTEAKNVIRDLFYGKARQILSYKDLKTSKEIQKVMEEDFSHVIVDATNRKTLYDGLDEHYFAEKVENFQGGQGATREVTVQHFPPILQIQIQRAQFDRSTCQVYKSNAFIQFDKTIYLDRYLDSNFQSLTPRREKVAMWRNQLAQCQQNVKNMSVKVDSTTSTPVDLPVSWMLEKAASILEGNSDANPSELTNAISQLNQEAANAKNILKANINKAAEYETMIAGEYNDLTNCAYQLHAVFMHRGEANYGHYWLYILDHKHDCWWKFNDSLVTKVKETEVFKDTSGTPSNAYFLVYIKQDLVDCLAAVSENGD